MNLHPYLTPSFWNIWNKNLHPYVPFGKIPSPKLRSCELEIRICFILCIHVHLDILSLGKSITYKRSVTKWMRRVTFSQDICYRFDVELVALFRTVGLSWSVPSFRSSFVPSFPTYSPPYAVQLVEHTHTVRRSQPSFSLILRKPDNEGKPHPSSQ